MDEWLEMEERAVSIMAEVTMGWMKAHERRRARVSKCRINFRAPFWRLLKVAAGAFTVWLVATVAGGFYG